MQKAIQVIKERKYKHESPMEKKIISELLEYNGIHFETQYEVGKFRLDIAFPLYKICLEIDGSKWHLTPAQRARDELRDAYLKSKGWKVERVPGWLVYRFPAMCVVKAVRHIPGIEQYKRYQIGKGQAITWLIGDLQNRGETENLEKVFTEL